MLFDHIAAEARPFIDTQDTGNAANDAADNTTYNRANRPCCALTFTRTMVDAARYTLRMTRNRRSHCH
jgi:hypothetical protein